MAAAPWTDPSVLITTGSVVAALVTAVKVLWSRVQAGIAEVAALHVAHAKAMEEARSAFLGQIDRSLAQIQSLHESVREDGSEMVEKYHSALTAFTAVIEAIRRNIERGSGSFRTGSPP